jgi:hypothetical protein
MKTLTGKKKIARVKLVTLYVCPFFNHWFGAEVYLKKPVIDQFGLSSGDERPYEVSIRQLFDFMGIKEDYEKFDYDHYKKEFENEEGGFQGGLMAEMIKVRGIMPVDKDENIIFAF